MTVKSESKSIQFACEDNLTKKVDYLLLGSGTYKMKDECTVPAMGFYNGDFADHDNAKKMAANYCLFDMEDWISSHIEGDKFRESGYYNCKDVGLVIDYTMTTKETIIIIGKDFLYVEDEGDKVPISAYSWNKGQLSILATVASLVPATKITCVIKMDDDVDAKVPASSFNISVQTPLDVHITHPWNGVERHLSAYTEAYGKAFVDPALEFVFVDPTSSKWKFAPTLIAEAKKVESISIKGEAPKDVKLERASILDRPIGEGTNEPDLDLALAVGLIILIVIVCIIVILVIIIVIMWCKCKGVLLGMLCCLGLAAAANAADKKDEVAEA